MSIAIKTVKYQVGGGGAYLFAYEHDSLSLLGDGLDYEVHANVVHVRHKDAQVVWYRVGWVVVLWYLSEENI